MAFCRKCGQEITDVDIFCTICGTPQSGGGPAAKVAVAAPNYFNDAKNVVLGMLARPVSTIRAVSGMQFPALGILAGSYAVIYGLLGMWMMGAVGGFFVGLINEIIGFKAVSKNSWANDIPWGSVFAYSLVISLVIMLGLYLGSFLIGKLMFKSNASSTPYANIAIACQTPCLAALTIAIIISYIYVPLGFLVLCMGNILSMVTLYFGLKEIKNIEDDIGVYGLPLIFLVLSIVLYLVIQILLSL